MSFRVIDHAGFGGKLFSKLLSKIAMRYNSV